MVGGGWGGGLLDYIVSPSPSPFHLDFVFLFLDLDLGLDLGLTIVKFVYVLRCNSVDLGICCDVVSLIINISISGLAV